VCPSLLHMELVGYDFLAFLNLFRKEDSQSAWASPTCHGKCRRRTGTFHNLTLIKDELKIFEVIFFPRTSWESVMTSPRTSQFSCWSTDSTDSALSL
jgi:hypothetical protein